MTYNIEKRKGLDKLGKKIFLNDYHKWLENERLKDKKKLNFKTVMLANYYLADGLCPYCKEKYGIKKKDGLMFRVCKTHGLLGVKKKEWRIWKDKKKIKSGGK
jgi:hypothetical protein